MNALSKLLSTAALLSLALPTPAAADTNALPNQLPPLPSRKSWKLIWSDEFEGTTLDTSKWEIIGDSKRRDGFWVKDDSYLDGQGNLLLRTRKDGDRFTSGAIRTCAKFEHAFGYWEIRCKLPTQPGHWPAFWLMCNGVSSLDNEGRDGTEIDIVEVPWRNGQITMNLHWDGYGKEHKSAGSKITIPSLTNGFHTFALWWKTNEYVFYTDGQETWRSSAGGVSQVPEFIKLTEEIGKWGGDIQKAKLPDYFTVDYVRVYTVADASVAHRMQVEKDPTTGQINITEAGKPVLRYNYQVVPPGHRLDQISSNNLLYARARSDYIHPLYGFDGEELTRDWPVDHPHHRGIYWAWPEVQFGGETGDLHALQRVFARPTGQCRWEINADYAQVDAENQWLWEDRDPIVRERALIRAYRETENGRCIDLEFHFTALKDNVTIARRETDKYGGLNIRLAAVRDQQITLRTESGESEFPISWAELSGLWENARHSSALLILQNKSNPDYPGDWVKFPELNWVQPTFPAAGTRFALKKNEPLVLGYRLWVSRPEKIDQETRARLWHEYNRAGNPPLAGGR